MTLLIRELATHTRYQTATVLIDPRNARSLAVAQRTGFVAVGEVDGQMLLSRPIARSV